MSKDRSERRNHLDLKESCLEIGGSHAEAKGVLALFLKTTIPKKKDKIYVCHACNNENCINSKHLYWGTPKDNAQDYKESGYYKSIYARGLEKYGKEVFHEKLRERQIKATITRSANKKLKNYEFFREKFEIEPKIRGYINKLSVEFGISHTHVRRIFNKLKI